MRRYQRPAGVIPDPEEDPPHERDDADAPRAVQEERAHDELRVPHPPPASSPSGA